MDQILMIYSAMNIKSTQFEAWVLRQSYASQSTKYRNKQGSLERIAHWATSFGIMHVNPQSSGIKIQNTF